MNTDTIKTTVTILGSGTCVPSLTRSSCSVLVQTAGAKILFDIGPGTIRRLLEADTTIFDISFIFISHFHPDHVGELVPFLFASKYPDPKRRNTPLTIVAGNGLLSFYEGLKHVFGSWMEFSFLNLIEMDHSGYDSHIFDAFSVESLPMRHKKESLAFRINGLDGISVVYSGDTDVCENLVTLSKGVDLLICESALPDALKVQGHLTPSEAGQIASSAGVRQLVLTHFYPECDTVDVTKECRKTYSGPLYLATDLMKIPLCPS